MDVSLSPSPCILTTREAARYCGVSAETIRRWIRTKGLPAYNTQLGLNIRIRREDLETFARQHNILLPGRLRPHLDGPPDATPD